MKGSYSLTSFTWRANRLPTPKGYVTLLLLIGEGLTQPEVVLRCLFMSEQVIKTRNVWERGASRMVDLLPVGTPLGIGW
jgi:hypothetical protein